MRDEEDAREGRGAEGGMVGLRRQAELVARVAHKRAGRMYAPVAI